MGGGEFVRRRKRIEYGGQTRIKNAVECEYIYLHGYIDIKDVSLDNGRAPPTPLTSIHASRVPVRCAHNGDLS